MFAKRFILLFSFVFIINALPLSAQSPTASEQETKTDKERQEEAQKKLTSQAFDLLEDVIKDTERLTLAENRAYVTITTADLLWPHDEKQARLLFTNAMGDVREILNRPAPEEEEQGRIYRKMMERSQLRQKLLLALAKYDARLARNFLSETRPTSPLVNEYGPVNEDQLEMNLASIIATHDPAQALEMAQKSLAKGFTYSLPNLVAEIQKKDGEVAAKLANDILAKLKTTKLTDNQEAYNVAARLFYMATEPAPAKANAAAKDATPLLSEQSLRELADLIAATVLNAPPEFVASSDLGQLLSRVEKYAPSRIAQLRRKSPQASEGGGGEEETHSWRQFQKLSETGTPDEIIAAAEKVGPEMRESYYRQAAFKLANDGQGDRARQVITARVTDPQTRQRMLADLDKQLLAAAAEKGNLDETRQYLSRVRTNEERIAALTQLAMTVGQKGDKKPALQLLEEARNLSPVRSKYSRHLLAQMMIARAYASLDASQSFAILEPTIDQLNELIAAGLLLGEFFGEEEFVRDDELMLQQVGQMIEMFQQQYGKDVTMLARADFTRTRNVADRFQRSEVRLLARLLIAQSILTPSIEETEKNASTEVKVVSPVH